MRDELVDIVNEHDQPIGTMMKRTAYDEKQTIRIVHVFIFNAKKELKRRYGIK